MAKFRLCHVIASHVHLALSSIALFFFFWDVPSLLFDRHKCCQFPWEGEYYDCDGVLVSLLTLLSSSVKVRTNLRLYVWHIWYLIKRIIRSTWGDILSTTRPYDFVMTSPCSCPRLQFSVCASWVCACDSVTCMCTFKLIRKHGVVVYMLPFATTRGVTPN